MEGRLWNNPDSFESKITQSFKSEIPVCFLSSVLSGSQELDSDTTVSASWCQSICKAIQLLVDHGITKNLLLHVTQEDKTWLRCSGFWMCVVHVFLILERALCDFRLIIKKKILYHKWKKVQHSPYCLIVNRKLEWYGLLHVCCSKVENLTSPFRKDRS